MGTRAWAEAAAVAFQTALDEILDVLQSQQGTTLADAVRAFLRGDDGAASSSLGEALRPLGTLGKTPWFELRPGAVVEDAEIASLVRGLSATAHCVALVTLGCATLYEIVDREPPARLQPLAARSEPDYRAVYQRVSGVSLAMRSVHAVRHPEDYQ